MARQSITNFSDVKFDELAARFPFLKEFDGIIVSAKERLLKPDPGIFMMLYERFDLAAASCIFIDDDLANVEAADQLG